MVDMCYQLSNDNNLAHCYLANAIFILVVLGKVPTTHPKREKMLELCALSKNVAAVEDAGCTLGCPFCMGTLAFMVDVYFIFYTLVHLELPLASVHSL